MTDKVTAICAVVSAHNEQALIGRCIDSLTAAARHARTQQSDVHVRIVIAADACTDNTLSLVCSTPGLDTIHLHARTDEAARAEGVSFGLTAFRHDPN
jgi:hypothetical protein